MHLFAYSKDLGKIMIKKENRLFFTLRCHVIGIAGPPRAEQPA